MGPHGKLVDGNTLNFRDAAFKDTRADDTGAPGGSESFNAHDVSVSDFGPDQRSLLQDGFEGAGSIDAFLHVDGVTGSSADAKHRNDIDVLSFSWGGDATPGTFGSGGAGVGKSTMQELHVVSRLSAASPKLLGMMDRGTHAPHGNLVLRSALREQVEFYKLSLDDVLVSSYQLTTAADGTPTEEFTLRYDASHLHYVQQNANGAPGATFDFAESGLGVDDFAPAQRSVLQSGPVLAPVGYHMLLQVDGVPGESRDAKHPGAIDVLAFEWGGDASGDSASGGGGGTGRTRFS